MGRVSGWLIVCFCSTELQRLLSNLHNFFTSQAKNSSPQLAENFSIIDIEDRSLKPTLFFKGSSWDDLPQKCRENWRSDRVACGECELLKSHQNFWAGHAKRYRRNNGRATPRQKDDCSWQSLLLCPICRETSAQSVTTDHHGEQSVLGSSDSSSKGKRAFP